MFSKKEIAHLRSLLSKAGQPPAASTSAPKKKRRRRTRGNGQPQTLQSSGVVSRVKYTETITDVKIAASKDVVVFHIGFNPLVKIGPSNALVPAFPVLSKFATIYESFKIMGVTLHWSSSVSAMVSGLAILAVDSNPLTVITSFAALEKLRPNVKFPVRQASRSLVVPSVMLSPTLLRHVATTATSPNYPIAICLGVKADKALTEATNFGVFSVTWDVQFVGISPTD